jgi:hypothetical protein
MYHPGKILKLFSPKDKDVVSADENFHALVEMWDEHIFTVLVDAKLAQKIREGDVVIIDYYPISAQSQIPKRIVVKILRGKASEFLWTNYKNYHKKHVFMRETVHEHDSQNEYMD